MPDDPYTNSSNLESSLQISESLSATLDTKLNYIFIFKKKKKIQISVKEQNPGNKNSARTQETFVEAVAPG